MAHGNDLQCLVGSNRATHDLSDRPGAGYLTTKSPSWEQQPRGLLVSLIGL
jgi:hypothetical protein